MAERKVLFAWKEISNYTGRGVRTIQRYESRLGFPIHRPTGTPPSSVLAFSDEIDARFDRAPHRNDSDRQLPKLSEGTLRKCRAIAELAVHGNKMAVAAWEVCMRQAQRVEVMMLRLEKYRKSKAA